METQNDARAEVKHRFVPDASPSGEWDLHPSRSENDFVLRFRRYHLVLITRELFYDNQPISLGGRAFDLLVVLLKSRGSVVTQNEIINYVWPSMAVEQSNLRFQMMSLRKALGTNRDMIRTIPGRGYLFAEKISAERAELRCLNQDIRSCNNSPAPSSPSVIGSPSEAAYELCSPTVAVIDDDNSIRQALQGLLQSVGLHVQTFASAQAFLDASLPSPPNCLVLDMWLPGLNGLQFQVELARMKIHSPIIFMSGYIDIHTCVQAMKGGAVEFLTKPVRPQELIDAVQMAMTDTGQSHYSSLRQRSSVIS